MQEDATRYGEFIPSFYHWLTPEKQKETAERLANLKNHPARESEISCNKDCNKDCSIARKPSNSQEEKISKA